MNKRILCSLLAVCWAAAPMHAATRPNIILIFADDISAREFPIYGSSVWTDPEGHDTSDQAYRAQTPVIDKLAADGCWIKTAWAATICSPSRAMMMTGRYAHLHKWWHNGDIGEIETPNGKRKVWPLYSSSPLLIGHVAQKAGYGTFWAGKTQMKNSDPRLFGFDEGVFTPGEEATTENPYSDFKIVTEKVNGEKTLINAASGLPGGAYAGSSFYWKPFVQLMNHPGSASDMVWWPDTPESQKSFGAGTYGPDVELKFVFDYINRQKEQNKPFFIYHTTHLGHGYFDWFNPDFKSWPGTPVIHWDGQKYTRTEPNVTGEKGVYDTHGTVTDQGIHHQINYIDYQVWLYQNKLKELGIEKNTILIVCADNGTSGYGKGSRDRQKGCHVPLIIHAPGMTKHGKQDVLASMVDFLPTIADLVGFTLPPDYEINGESLVPFLFTDKPDHRKWLYAYREDEQIFRGTKVMKDGNENWWQVDSDPADLISFEQITNWGNTTEVQRDERDKLEKATARFNVHDTEHDAPGTPSSAKPSKKKLEKKKKGKEKGGQPDQE